jgi:hypothetical protein
MSTEKNVRTVKDFFAAIDRGDREGVLALVAEDVEWIIPGEDWPLGGTRHGHAALADLVKTQSETMEISLTEPRVRFRCGLPGCLPPCTDRTGMAQPSGTFTSRLSTDRSPSPSLDMTTTVTGLI